MIHSLRASEIPSQSVSFFSENSSARDVRSEIFITVRFHRML